MAVSGTISGSTLLTVTAAPLVSISVTPANPSIAKDTTQQFTAIGTYSDATMVDITTSVTWTSGTTAVATVLSTSGLASGLAAGTSMITAVSGTISGSTLLTVTQASVSLRTAANYGVLANTGITNTGTSTVTGDIGTISGTISGDSITVIDGTQHAVNDAATVQAQTDLGLAYIDAAARPSTTVDVELGGTTRTPGVYSAGTLSITTGAGAPLILDGQGDPNAVFIFKASSTLTTTGTGSVSLTNGASWYNVFWVVGSSATIGGGSLEGTILAQTSISLGTGTPVHGRLLARDGAVTLLGNTISRP
jgi:hypothetical protein